MKLLIFLPIFFLLQAHLSISNEFSSENLDLSGEDEIQDNDLIFSHIPRNTRSKHSAPDDAQYFSDTDLAEKCEILPKNEGYVKVCSVNGKITSESAIRKSKGKHKKRV